MQIYIHRNEEELGPYSTETALEGLKRSEFDLHDYARTAEMQEYRQLGDLLGIVERPTNKAASLREVKVASPAGVVGVLARPNPRAAAIQRTGRLARPGAAAGRNRAPIAWGLFVVALAVAGWYVGFSPAGAGVRARLASMWGEFGKTARRDPAPSATPAPAPKVAVAPVAPPAPDVPKDIPRTPEPPPLPAPVAPPEFDLAKLGGNPAAWPKAVRLLQDVNFPAVLNGRAVGTVKVPAGSPVKLVNITGVNLTLEYQGGRVLYPWKLTNLEEAAREVAKLAAAATPVPAPEAKSAPLAVGTASSASWMWKTAGPNYESPSKVDTSSMPESYGLERALLKWKYQLTPEVESAYLQFSKVLALREITNSQSLLPADFLGWIDSDPVVATTVYGARKDAAGVLCMLRSLELDLGRDAVRHEYTQLALAMAVAEASHGATADLSARNPLQLTIPGDPRHPVNTKAKDRPLDVNDHIINFLEDHAPIDGEPFGRNERPPELKYDTKGVAILTESKVPKGAAAPSHVKRALVAADVLESKALQEEFNAYMAAHGQSVHIDCGDHVIFPNQHDAIKGQYAAGIKKAYELFRTAYEAKGRLPQSRDPLATPAERCAFLIRNDSHFPEHIEGQRKWDRFPLKSAPWPTMTLLAQENDPLREREEVWERFADKGEAVTYGEYIGDIAQQFDYQSARRLSPYAFTYQTFQMMMKDGGVCGTMASMSVRTHTALGTPATTAGQPGHCALILFALDKKTHTYQCRGEQYATGGDDDTHPHAKWIFGDIDARRDMVWHQSVAWGVNAGFQSYLDSMVALDIYRNLPKAEQKAQGLTLLQSGLGVNRYNIALVEAAVAQAGDPKDFGAFVGKLLDEHGSTPGCPSKGLYRTTVEQIVESRTLKADGKVVALQASAK